MTIIKEAYGAQESRNEWQWNDSVWSNCIHYKIVVLLTSKIVWWRYVAYRSSRARFWQRTLWQTGVSLWSVYTTDKTKVFKDIHFKIKRQTLEFHKRHTKKDHECLTTYVRRDRYQLRSWRVTCRVQIGTRQILICPFEKDIEDTIRIRRETYVDK